MHGYDYVEWLPGYGELMRIKRLAVMGTAAAAAVAGALHLKKKRAANNQEPYSYGSSDNSKSDKSAVADAASSVVDDTPFVRSNQ
jgi:phage-related protein